MSIAFNADCILCHIRRQTATARSLGTEEQAIAAYERMGQLLQGTDRAECMTLEQLIGEFFDRMNDQTPPDYLDLSLIHI